MKYQLIRKRLKNEQNIDININSTHDIISINRTTLFCDTNRRRINYLNDKNLATAWIKMHVIFLNDTCKKDVCFRNSQKKIECFWNNIKQEKKSYFLFVCLYIFIFNHFNASERETSKSKKKSNMVMSHQGFHHSTFFL